MDQPRVTAVRGLELAVFDLKACVKFYTDNWALSEVARQDGVAYLRASGAEHHVLALHERPRAGLIAVNMAAPDSASVDALHARAQGKGMDVLSAPSSLPAAAGGGYGFEVRTPEGQTIRISSNVASHADTIDDPARPSCVNHVVLNAAQMDEQMSFFLEVLGFRHSDFNGHMNFIRCSANHHSIALARSQGASLNHVAFEMKDFDGLMRGVGRMQLAEQEIGWGVGRHAGPGRNIFSYFVDPNGYAIEYTTDVDQVDDSYVTRFGDYWQNVPLRPCAWAGSKMVPSPRMRAAMEGKLVEELNRSCDDAISEKMAG